MSLTEEQRRGVVSLLVVGITTFTSLLIVLGANGLLDDAIATVQYDGSQTASPYSDQTAVPPSEATEAVPWVEQTPTQEKDFPPRPTKVATCIVKLKSSYPYTTANVRQGANIHTSIIRTIKPGEQYLFLGVEGEWYRIEVPGGTGYVANWIVDREC